MPIQTDSAPHSMPSCVTLGWGTPLAGIAHGIVAPSIRRVGYSGHMHMPTKQEIRYQWEHGGPVMAWALIAACTAVWLVGDRVGHRAYRGVQFCQSIWLDVALIPLWIPPGQCPIILSTCAQLCMKVHKTVDNLCG